MSDDQDESEDESEGTAGAGAAVDDPLAALQEKLKELSTAYELVVKNSHQLSKLTTELESGSSKGASAGTKPKEKFALLKLTLGAMVKVSKSARLQGVAIIPYVMLFFIQAAEEFMVQARGTERRWSRALQHEHSLRLQLQENMEALANQMHGLEDEARLSVFPLTSDAAPLGVDASSFDEVAGEVGAEVKGKKPAMELDRGQSDSDDDDKFFDAPEIFAEELKRATDKGPTLPFNRCMLEGSAVGHRRNISTISVNDSTAMISTSDSDVREKLPQVSSDRRMVVSVILLVQLTFSNTLCQVPAGPSPSFLENASVPTLAVRRTTIPPKPSHKLNLWSVMKNCIGKDLSKIPMPVSMPIAAS